MNDNGHILATQFNQLGLAVKLVKTEQSPQCITYYFDCLNIGQFSKTRVEKLLEKMSAYNHIKITYVETTESHFAITHANPQRQPLFLTSLSFTPNSTTDIKLPIGKDINNKDLVLDFGVIPHILIGGTTGSGKSVLINTIISSLYISTPKSMFELVLIDPKKVELARYQELSNVKFIDETDEAVYFLSTLCGIMETRYAELERVGKKNGDNYFKPIFVVIDELADLMLTSRYEVEESIVRLSQKARAVGIHLIVATQSPRATIITGLIKANMPCKIGLKMASYRESVIMLDHKGCENLIGFGDALIKLPNKVDETRFQVAYISDERINEIISRGGN